MRAKCLKQRVFVARRSDSTGAGGADGGGKIHVRTSEGSGHASEPVVSENESEAMVKHVPLGAQVLLLESQ